MQSYVSAVSESEVSSSGNNFKDIFRQYERILVESLITTFGLDIILQRHDQLGGDVDTIHNVREIGKEGSQITYKNDENLVAYELRGNYDSRAYHSHPEYIKINRSVSEQKKSGTLMDAYTGERIDPNGKTDLDHIISAKEIHDDRGRVLSGLSGEELANTESNLRATNPHTNRTKKAMSMEEFHEKKGSEYSEEQLKTMRKLDSESRKEYDSKLAISYYTSAKFRKDMAVAAGKVGARMAARQAIGFIFAEIWFSVKEKFQSDEKIENESAFGNFIKKISDGIKIGFQNAKSKYKELLQRTLGGAVSGTLASITTTISNIFFTTSKNVVTLIRQVYVSFVEAVKVLILNPNNLPLGEKLRTVSKIIATGASVAIGVSVNLAIAETPLGKLPIIGDIVQNFCGTFVTGIMSCTLLMFFDRSKIINQLVVFLNTYSMQGVVSHFKEVGIALEKYASELMKIDINKFREEIKEFNVLVLKIENINSDKEMNAILKQFYQKAGLPVAWKGDFRSFMGDRNNRLVFE